MYIFVRYRYNSMGSSEMDKTPKEDSKTAPPTSQEQSPTTNAGTVNPDWSGFQVFNEKSLCWHIMF